MSMSFFQRSAARMIDNGFPVIPIAPHEKFPGDFSSGQWRPLQGWRKYAFEKPSDFQVSLWSSYPESGVGVPCGRVVAIDIDVKDPDISAQCMQAAIEILGDTPLLRIGEAPKKMLIYRTQKPFAGIKRHPVEVLCDGQQFVAYGVHPVTDQPYTWPLETPDDTDYDELPEITEEMAHKWAARCQEIIPDTLKPKTLGASPAASEAHETSSESLQGDFNAIKDALAFIDNPDLDYDSWLGIGLALKGALGNAGQGLFEEWSAQASKNDPAYTTKTWQSLNPHSKGAGSIYHLAGERGWTPGLELDLNPEKARLREEVASVDISGLLSSSSQVEEGVQELPKVLGPGIFPVHLAEETDGLIREITNWVTASSIFPQQELALLHTITGLGTVYGRRYTTDWNTRTNLYTVGVAPTGSGKDHSRKKMKDLFGSAGLTNLLMGDDFTSGAAVLTALNSWPSKLAHVDEFGLEMKSWGTRSNGGVNPKSGIKKTLMSLYSSSSGLFHGTEYSGAGGRVNADRQDIVQPNLSLYGTTTEDELYDALTGAEVNNGYLNRFIFVCTSDGYPDSQTPTHSDPPAELVARLRDSYNVRPENAGDIAELGAGISTPALINVELDEAAVALRERATKWQQSMMKEGKTFSTLWGRYVENTLKIAMISAISHDPVSPTITEDRFLWAQEIVSWAIQYMTYQCSFRVVENRNEFEVMRMVQVVSELSCMGKKPFSRTDISRATRSLKKRERDDMINNLQDMGVIRAVSIKVEGSKGRPTVKFVADLDGMAELLSV